jgi:ABC-2 type transport system ATP-binding protein
VTAREGSKQLATIVRALDDAEIEVEDLGLRRPTLDEVFLVLTGHSTADHEEGAA